MNLLFEAKVVINNQIIFYNIFRLQPNRYKAEIVLKEDTDENVSLPDKIILIKHNETWYTEDNKTTDLSTTIGAEIDVFNTGYGDLLGRIGVS